MLFRPKSCRFYPALQNLAQSGPALKALASSGRRKDALPAPAMPAVNLLREARHGVSRARATSERSLAEMPNSLVFIARGQEYRSEMMPRLLTTLER